MDVVGTICKAFFLVLLFLFVGLLAKGKENQIQKKQYMGMLGLLIIVFLIWSVTFVPTSITRWDLLEHYKELDKIRSQGWNYLWTQSEFGFMPAANLYFYLISLLPNNQLLPLFPLIIDGAVFLYIFQDSLKVREAEQKISYEEAFFITIIWISTFGMKLAVSGIRCVVAAAFCALAIYLERIKKKHKGLAVVCYILGVTTHYFAFLIIAIRLLSSVRKKAPILIGLALFVLFGSRLAELLIGILPGMYLKQMTYLVIKYWNIFDILSWLRSVTAGEKTIYFCFAFMVFYFFYIIQKTKRNLADLDGRNEEIIEKGKRTLELGETLAWVALIFLLNYLLTERLMYFLAYGFLMALPYYFCVSTHKKYMDIIAIPFALWLWFMNDLYIFIVNDTGVFFLAK